MPRHGVRQGPSDEPGYIVLASPWNNRWDVFVLDPANGLVGVTVAISRGEIEAAAVALLRRDPARDRERIRITLVN
jgi:hypothetical protein